MRKFIALLLVTVMTFIGISCGDAATITAEEEEKLKPEVSQMRSICELSVLDCYYHNVAKYKEEDAVGILFWKKDKHFWIEYSGIVRIGIDASKVLFSVDGNDISITLPAAKVLGCRVDEESLNENSYITSAKAGKSEAADAIKAFSEAEQNMRAAAESDSALLANAQERTKTLIEDYVKGIGQLVGEEYHISWIYADPDGKPLDGGAATSAGQTEGN